MLAEAHDLPVGDARLHLSPSSKTLYALREYWYKHLQKGKDRRRAA